MRSQQAVVADGAAGATVVVEVLTFRVTGGATGGAGLAYRESTGELGDGRHPDTVARDLLRSGPASPSPSAPRIGQVAAHAVRHLAFLRHTDPTAGKVIESIPSLADVLAPWSPAPAGQFPEPRGAEQVAFSSR